MTGGSFDITLSQSSRTAVWFDLYVCEFLFCSADDFSKVPSGTTPGDHVGTLTVGGVVVTVKLHVFGFAIPLAGVNT